MIYRVKASNPMLYNLLQPARKKRFETVFPEQQGVFFRDNMAFSEDHHGDLWMQTACRKTKSASFFA